MKRLVSALVVIAVLGFGTSRGYDWWNYNVNTPVSSASEPVVFHIDPGAKTRISGGSAFRAAKKLR